MSIKTKELITLLQKTSTKECFYLSISLFLVLPLQLLQTHVATDAHQLFKGAG